MYSTETRTHELEDVTHQRVDGTFVGVVLGMPYHITPDDPLWEQALELASQKKEKLVPDPVIVSNTPRLTLTARQLRLGLIRSGISSTAVLSCINSISDTLKREEMMIEWEYSTEYTKTNALVQLLKTRLFTSEPAFDEFWISSAAL